MLGLSMSHKRCAVLITCYNRVSITLLCLENLFKVELPLDVILDVYLVDDKSPDHTGGIVKKQYPDINVIEGTGSLYWNRGMYLAWKTAANAYDYDCYLWLNDDIILFPAAIKEMLFSSEKLNKMSIIVGSTCSQKNGEFTYGGYLLDKRKIFPDNTLQKCDIFCGNCVLIPGDVFHVLGNLDPFFHHAIGDLDYGFRARKAGVKCYVFEKYVGYCEMHETFPDWCLKEVPLVQRLRSLYSPLGNSQPYYYFRYELRNFGIHIALLHLLTIHLRLVFPQLWK